MNITKYAGVALIALSIAGTAHAENASSTKPNMGARGEVRKEIQQDLKADKASTTRAEAKTKASERLSKVSQEASRRLAKALDRLSDVRAKIDAYLTKAETAGRPTAGIRAALTSADALIATAKTDVGAIASTTISDSTPKASLDALKTAVRKAEASVKAAHNALQRIIPMMRTAGAGKATTTNQ
jgi:hypothetical protein